MSRFIRFKSNELRYILISFNHEDGNVAKMSHIRSIYLADVGIDGLISCNLCEGSMKLPSCFRYNDKDELQVICRTMGDGTMNSHIKKLNELDLSLILASKIRNSVLE